MTVLSEQRQKDVEIIRASELFDADWYLETYPDVRALKMDPALHYLKYGAMMRRDPGPRFSTGFYADTHSGVARHNLNPLVYFLTRVRPPAADRNLILLAAHREAKRHGFQRGAELAAAELPEDLAYTVEILRANAALERGAEADWLAHVNRYLQIFGLAPLQLHGTGSIIERLATAALPPVSGGPLVSVIMPAWNAEKTVQAAARSILNQTWQNLELLIVDDCSEDGTWACMQQIAASDSRVKLRRNVRNVGPYVSKNLALMQAKGDYITGHDADDWAHPQRLENHLKTVLASNGAMRASVTSMIRMRLDGWFDHVGKVSSFSFDGVARVASISCLFEGNLLRQELGYWDSVRFGADSEMIQRAMTVAGAGFQTLRHIGMICMDLETSLTNHPVHGVSKTAGISPIRANYRTSWTNWLENKTKTRKAFLDFPQKTRRYDADAEMVPAHDDIIANIGSDGRNER